MHPAENVRDDKRINVDVPADLKRKLALYCVTNDLYIKDVVIMALELFLDEMEVKKN